MKIKMPHNATLTQARQRMVESVYLEMTTAPNHHRNSFDQFDEMTKLKMNDMRTTRSSLKLFLQLKQFVT